MNSLRISLCMLFLVALASATQGTWMLYYSDIETINADNSVTVTPTVAITGDDDGYCNIWAGFYGWETPFVMLNGNAWAMGDTQGSGGENYGGYPLGFSYTFPDVTIPSNGTQVDLSYAGKVQGTRYLTYGEGAVPPFNLASFFITTFVDGQGSISPSPCFLGGSPVCSLPFPYSFQTVPAHGHPSDLYSQDVKQVTSRSCPTSVTLSSTTAFVLADNFPQWKTGLGIVAFMQVNPPTQPDGISKWNGTQIQEYVSVNSSGNSCPSNVPVCSQSGSPLTVGTGASYFGKTWQPADNIMWDLHVKADSTSLLNASGVTQTSCTMPCSQTYKCNGTAIGTFGITYNFSRGTIQGTPVTNVSATKQ